MRALTNGHYVTHTNSWNNGVTADVGAVTWGNGNGGTVGAVSSSNSLVGSTANDTAGNGGVTALTNGNYVVLSNAWGSTDFGAATWGNGATGTAGTVSGSNSLVGTTNGDFSSAGVPALTNGHYVVRCPIWDGAAANVGAVTWANGTTGATIGAISSTNSLIGSTLNDQVGSTGVMALTNGHYVVRSSFWNVPGGAFDVGAATWGNGTGGTVGAVSSTNSLVGSTTSDWVGYTAVTALSTGHYVVTSAGWDNGSLVNAGAATW